MAGIIGERYIEITPGDNSSPVLSRGAAVRGVDPPRIDQLISQGYGVFGKIQEFLEQNEKSVTDFVKSLDQLLRDANRLLRGEDKKKFFELVDNLNEITGDMKGMVKDLRDPNAKEVFRLLSELVKRAHEVDKAALKKFLQEEGVKARIF
jgi:phospholipid/cholesterol/gamma-HCH transport system substrate-binding protein